LAILVPKNILVEKILSIIDKVGGSLIRDVDLFDIYEGEELPAGKKNLAFHLIFQAEDKTLSAEEIDNLLGKIIKALEGNPQWEVRRQ
jgi:phenylalanyl-tRNA synthetase beta chain